jgi:hypothetical protein
VSAKRSKPALAADIPVAIANGIYLPAGPCEPCLENQGGSITEASRLVP